MSRILHPFRFILTLLLTHRSARMRTVRRFSLLLSLLAVPASTLVAQTEAKQSSVGIQGSLGFGGGDKLGFGGSATLGPRLGKNLLSIRASVGTGVTIADTIGAAKYRIYEVGLLYGRRFCSPGACYGFGIGPGYVSQVVLNPITNLHERDARGALLWQLSLQGTITPTTTLGITLLGNRNSAAGFWGVTAGVQFGMPRQSSHSDDDDE